MEVYINNKYKKYTDKELIKLVLNDPEGHDGKVAKEELEYRKYLVMKRNNNIIVFLTIILALSSLLQLLSIFCLPK